MTKKIFHSILFTSITVLLSSLLVATCCLYYYFGDIQHQRLKSELNLAACAVEEAGINYLQRLTSLDFRLTWVGPDGTVRYDTQTPTHAMENHADREEILEAFATGTGSSTRYSTTLTEKTVYYAVALSDGSVLRISVSEATSLMLALGFVPLVFFVAVLAVLLSWRFAKRMATIIVTPLNEVDLEHPLNNDTYEEISPLLSRIHHQHRQIQAQLLQLQQKTDEFAQITASMKEGLILLDRRGTILSINPAARTLFGVGTDCIGAAFLTIDRSHNINRAIQSALADGHKEIRGERGGRTYQFDISRIETDNIVEGAVILSFDVTEQEAAERIRREFTANVSHELKTPLQSILGSAELLENHLVQPADMPRFLRHIRKEAARLVSLIEDIIHLSQLDEGGEMPQENVPLQALAEEVAVSLQDAADAKKVRLSISGSTESVFGVHRLLYEILYNLCDNAIKYNVEGGSVQIQISGTERESVITVRDTGIGIAPEHHSRIFERFYRVDKSHSRQSGGTGLGLSIVKHAVQYHNGTLELSSKPGHGTSITVKFPKCPH